MKFFEESLLTQSFYKQLETALQANTLPAAVSGLSSIHKAHVIATLCARFPGRALVLAGEESEGARLVDDLNTMGCPALFYPLRDFTLRQRTAAAMNMNTSGYRYCVPCWKTNHCGVSLPVQMRPCNILSHQTT